MWYLWLLHGNSGYANVPQCYVIRTLSVLLNLIFYINVFWYYIRSMFQLVELNYVLNYAHRSYILR